MIEPQSTRARGVADVDAAPSDRRPWYRGRLVWTLSWACTAAVAAYAAVRLLGIEQGWLLVTTIAFTPYMALTALAGAGAQALVRHWRAAAATAVLGVAMVAAVMPRTVASEQPAAHGAELTVVSVNLYIGAADLEYIVDLVDEHRPDFLSVQELTPYALDELARLGLEERMPHVVATTGWAAEGTALYSLHPLTRLEQAEPDGIFHQVAAEAALPDGSAVRIMAVHTAAPSAPHRIPLWEEDFRQFPRADGGAPWVLAGDFNATLDHHAMRALLAGGYGDAADETGKGLAATWRPVEGYLGGLVRPPAVALDHVLVEEGVAVLDFQVLDRRGSDHAPVVATVRLPES